MEEKKLGDDAQEWFFDLQFKNILAPQNIADFGGRVPTNIYGISRDQQNILGIRKTFRDPDPAGWTNARISPIRCNRSTFITQQYR